MTADFVPTDTTNYTSLIDVAAGNFVITKATPTATLTVSNSPQTYTGVGLAATVTLTSSVPGAVTNLLTGGAATQTTAGTYAVTADFVPTDTTNYTTLTGLAAGNFVITKATPTATLTVSNSPQTYTGVGLAATVTLTSSVPGTVTNILTGGTATKTTAGTYAVTADFVPTDTANYTSLIDVAAGNFVITKATPTATLAVTNSPQPYTGIGLAATVSVSASSVPGTVTNILTGGAATKTTAGTYAVTADFVPTDTANYTSLIDVAAGNFVITKATPTATLTVSNSPQTYTGAGLAATVTLTSSVPGAVTNVRTGGAATQTTAGTYAVTADFVPTDTTNYTSLIALAAGNFVITKATPTATLTVSNSPQTYTGAGLAATVTLTSSVPGAVTNVRTGGGDADDGRDLCGDGGLRADRHGELHLVDRPGGRELCDHQGDADGDAGGKQFAADVHRGQPGGHRHAHELGAGDGHEHSDRRDRDQDDGGDVRGDGGLCSDRHRELHLVDRPRGRELRDHQGDADGDADGEQFAADVHRCRPRRDGHAHELGARRGDERAHRRRGDADNGRDVCGDGGLRPDRHDQLRHADGAHGGQLRDHQGDADRDADGEQLAARWSGWRDGFELGARDGDEHSDRRDRDQTTAGTLRSSRTSCRPTRRTTPR